MIYMCSSMNINVVEVIQQKNNNLQTLETLMLNLLKHSNFLSNIKRQIIMQHYNVSVVFSSGNATCI